MAALADGRCSGVVTPEATVAPRHADMPTMPPHADPARDRKAAGGIWDGREVLSCVASVTSYVYPNRGWQGPVTARALRELV